MTQASTNWTARFRTHVTLFWGLDHPSFFAVFWLPCLYLHFSDRSDLLRGSHSWLRFDQERFGLSFSPHKISAGEFNPLTSVVFSVQRCWEHSLCCDYFLLAKAALKEPSAAAMSQSRGYFKLRLASSLAGRQRTPHAAGWCSSLTHASSCVRGSQAFQAVKGRLVWAKIPLMLTDQKKRVESGQAISQVPQLLSVGILTSLVNKEWTHQNRFIIKISTCTAQLFTAPFICISCSRRTGQYTVQQNTHGDRHGPSTTADGTKPSQPLPIPRSQPYCSPKNSPNSRSRRPPSCQRCNSQVGGTVNSDLCFFWDTYCGKVIGVFAFRVLNIVFCFDGCVSDRSRSSKVMFRPAAFF